MDGKQLDQLVERFLTWPLPQSVCSDLCATDRNYRFPRSGTNLLTAGEARQMVEHLLDTPFIAAAPDLLEALKGVVAVADRKTVEFDKAHAAIAKAQGG